ncbi:MAG: hypothetical protein ACMXX8_03035 [Candidatus Woesearchaeota archaeon]
MRSSRREAKRIRRNRMMIGGITIFIMLGGGLGIFASNIGLNENVVPYNEHNFELTQRGWQLRLNNERYYFTHHPLEVENINSSNEIFDKLKEKNNILLSFDPNSVYFDIISDSQFYLSEKLSKQGKNIAQGFSNESNYNVPIINCDNADENTLVILFKDGEKEIIVMEDNCIKAYSSYGEGFPLISNKILFGILNII